MTSRRAATRPAWIMGTVLLPPARLERAIVHLSAGRIQAIETAPSPAVERALRRDGGGLILPSREVLSAAFIDVHCHGAGGGSAHGEPASLWLMAETLLAHGVGSFVATTVTAPLPELEVAARRVAEMAEEQVAASRPAPAATILGLHLEGPALTPSMSAGHDPAAFVPPAVLACVLAREPGPWNAVRVVTFAPELDGGLALARQLSEAGIVGSVGHTAASASVATAAYEAGARSTTHLFSGMPPLHHRSPGPIGAALAASPFVELLCDGIHIESDLLAPVARAIGDDRLLLVSDAVPLAGSRLRSIATPGGSAHVVGSRALDQDGNLAGSRLLLDGMVEGAVHSGIALETALRAATTNPARLLGLPDRGRLEAGAIADLVTVTRGGRLRRVLQAGSVL